MVFLKAFWPELTPRAFVFVVNWRTLQTGYIGRPIDWLRCALLKEEVFLRVIAVSGPLMAFLALEIYIF
jgi:hypothetical protein